MKDLKPGSVVKLNADNWCGEQRLFTVIKYYEGGEYCEILSFNNGEPFTLEVNIACLTIMG